MGNSHVWDFFVANSRQFKTITVYLLLNNIPQVFGNFYFKIIRLNFNIAYIPLADLLRVVIIVS